MGVRTRAGGSRPTSPLSPRGGGGGGGGGGGKVGQCPAADGSRPTSASACRRKSSDNRSINSSTPRQVRRHCSSVAPGEHGAEQTSTYVLAFGSVPLGRRTSFACSPQRKISTLREA